MNRILSLALAGTLASSLACAENFTQSNVEKAQAIIAAALEAHGGEALLNDLHTLTVEHETLNYSVDQSRSAEPPWDKSEASGVNVIDLDNSVFANHAVNSGGGFESRTGTIINGDESYQIDYRAGTIAEIAEPDFDTTSGPFFRVTPALLLRSLNDRSANAHYLGETELDEKAYDVIGFSMTVGPAISLYFDKETHLLHRSERVFPGFGLVEYEFKDYAVADGILFNKSFNLFLNGDPNIERENISMKVNASLEELIATDATLAAIPQVQPDPLSRQEVADGVWLIGGSGTYAMFVDMGDYIFAAGGTGGSPDRLESLREVVGDKPIRYGLMTHHHFDHVLAVPSYEEEGATIIASAAHERIIRRAADDTEGVSLKLVNDRMTLESGDRRIEIIDIGPTAHTDHLLIAYLPDEGILFEADHFAMPRSGPIPPAVSSTRTFAKALERLNLDVKTLLSAHSSRPGSWEDLQTALQTREHQASR
jgi:glyoxylase-like metal-dependent hydrolase (beta-lactamase superfamily II)